MLVAYHHQKHQVDHEETCEFRPYSCPCPGASCKWQGSLEQVCVFSPDDEMPSFSSYTFNVSTLDSVELYWLRKSLTLNLPLHQVMAHLMQVHKSITTLQGEDIVFLATDINLPGDYLNGF